MFLTPVIENLNFYCWIFIFYLSCFKIEIAIVSSLLLMFLIFVNHNMEFRKHKGCSALLWLQILLFNFHIIFAKFQIGFAFVLSLLLRFLTYVIENINFWRHKGFSCLLWFKSWILWLDCYILFAPVSKPVLHLFLAYFWCSWLL